MAALILVVVVSLAVFGVFRRWRVFAAAAAAAFGGLGGIGSGFTRGLFHDEFITVLLAYYQFVRALLAAVTFGPRPVRCCDIIICAFVCKAFSNF